MRRLSPEEFVQLPFFPWASRPESYPLDVEEIATALYLENGNVHAAAALLKVTPARLMKVVRRSPRLQRLRAQLTDAYRVAADELKMATGSQSPPAPQPDDA